MNIYIIHYDKIYSFSLPKTVSGSYVLSDYDKENHVRNLATISSKNNSWYMKTNDNIMVNYNGSNIQEISLVNYNFYNLNIYNKESIVLYTFPVDENNLLVKEVTGNCTLTVGTHSSSDIVFLSSNIAPKQLELSYNDGSWFIKNLSTNIPIYVNNLNVVEKKLDSFDIVFVMGIRIIIMGPKLFLVGLGTMFQVKSQHLLEEQKRYNINNINVDENIKDFYNTDDYFSKSPVFIKKYSDYPVTITSPNQKEKYSDSILSQLVPSALMSATTLVSGYYTIQQARSGTVDRETIVMNIVMCVVMLITGIVWPIIESIAGKIKFFITSRLRVINYKKYLKRKRKELTKIMEEEKQSLEFNNLSLEACQDVILKKNSYLFSRNVDSDLFLSLKIGVGRIKSSISFDYKRPDLIIDNDKLLDDIDKLINDFKYLDDAPFIISLKKINSIAFINSSLQYNKYIKSLILQLITFHDYESLKIAVFTNEFSELNKMKNLNHCWNDDRSFRFFATNSIEAENVSSELTKIFDSYNHKSDSSSDDLEVRTHYVIITDSLEEYKNLKIFDEVIRQKGTVNFSLIMFTSRIVNVPIGCQFFVDYKTDSASYFQSEMTEDSIFKFKPELLNDKINFDLCINTMCNIPIKINTQAKGNLPDKLGFLEMYNVGRLEQLNILNRWKTSPIINSLAAPVGVDPNGNILNLDLHEKKHGPHGLIAGMTGSGKSEFIVTYILSLAINYSPDEVQFVLIDYKGGGLAGAFENRKSGIKLPHLVGTITNLDKSEMNRTLVSIKSELQRRQRVFNKAKEELNTGSIDIYKYQNLVREGVLSESMSHLFIICDEFAELKAQQPDFMDELVSAARIGRSLGIHLILATQKPSGVVDEQIWSNSKFKVCCKVQTTDDSMEMIRKPDAASIKESGRFYLQVGYDQYFVLGQSGYSGVQYMPSDTVVSKIDDTVSFINNNGDVYKSVEKKKNKNDENKTEYGEELNNILAYIIKIANENGYVNHQLWLDNVPKYLLFDTLSKKYNNYKTVPYVINPLIGEYDDPKNQLQGYVTLPLSQNGNTVVFGLTGMGKTTFISTFIYSTILNHSPKEVNFYIADFTTERLRKFINCPHVGDFVGINDAKKLKLLFNMLESEIAKRQKYYTDIGTDFDMEVKKGVCKFPNIVVIIHGYDVFKDTFFELDEKMVSISRGCTKFGIYIIATCTSTASVSYNFTNNFPQRIALTLNDATEYGEFFPGNVVPSKNPGRGLINIDSTPVEFQTSIIADEDKEQYVLNYVINKLCEFFPKKAPSIPSVPRHLNYYAVNSYVSDLTSVPIGINIDTAQIALYDFTKKISIISSMSSECMVKFSKFLFKILSVCKNNKVIVLNSIDKITCESSENIKFYSSNFSKIISVISNNIKKYNSSNESQTFTIVILGYSKINSHLLKMKGQDDSILLLDDLILMSKNDNFKFIIYDSSSTFEKIINGNLSELIDNQFGIWVGPDFEMQMLFDSDRVLGDVRFSNENCIFVNDGSPNVLKYPTIYKEENDE